MVYCKNCKFFKGRESSVSTEFIDGESESISCPSGEIVKLPTGIYQIEGFGFIKMCQHPECFTINKVASPERQIIKKERIKGQAQLNSDNQCKFYKRKWWKIWIR